MKTINIKGKDIDLKYSFNSFKYMQDFDAGDFDELEMKPFKIVPLVVMMLMGALNHSPKNKIKEDDVHEFMEEFIVDGDLSQLMEDLMELLQESNFFKSLRKKV